MTISNDPWFVNPAVKGDFRFAEILSTRRVVWVSSSLLQTQVNEEENKIFRSRISICGRTKFDL